MMLVVCVFLLDSASHSRCVCHLLDSVSQSRYVGHLLDSVSQSRYVGHFRFCITVKMCESC